MCLTPNPYTAKMEISRGDGELYTPCIFAELSGKARGPCHCSVTGLGQQRTPYPQWCHGQLAGQKGFSDVYVWSPPKKARCFGCWVEAADTYITYLEATLGPALFFSLSLLSPAGASPWGTTPGGPPLGTTPGDHPWRTTPSLVPSVFFHLAH